MKLTDKAVAALTLRRGQRERVESDDHTTGLYLRLRASAGGITKRWLFRYSRGGRAYKFTFDYPANSLAAVRRQIGELQAKLRLGFDPAEDRRRGKADALETMGAVLPAYLEQKRAVVRPRSFTQLERHLTKYYAPLHQHPLSAVTLAMVTARNAAIAKGSGTTTAKNAWRSLHAFMSWAVRQGLIDRNPAVGVEHPPDRKRARVLSAAEIKAVWDATADNADDYSAIVRLLLLSGCRASEIAGLRWSEMFSDRIVLPPERVKNHRQHSVPLTATMRVILERCVPRPDKDMVFGRSDTGPFSGWSKSKSRLDARIKAAGGKMAPWVIHDLRRTFATGLGELGTPPSTIEAAINHASGFRHGVGGIYNRASLESQVRRALEVWDAHVREIVEGRMTGDRVVPLRA
jgi:integrase